MRKRVAVLISGRGSNMAALVEAARAPDYPAEIVGVISDRADAKGLDWARNAGIEAHAVPQSNHAGKAAHERAIDTLLGAMGVEIVCLAGFMRVLSPAFVERWSGRLINIHPSLLPRHKGLDTHARALAAGDLEHGCTVHHVTAGVDDGPAILQVRIPILPGDTPESLAARVLAEEHRLYPAALRMVAEGKA